MIYVSSKEQHYGPQILHLLLNIFRIEYKKRTPCMNHGVLYSFHCFSITDIVKDIDSTLLLDQSMGSISKQRTPFSGSSILRL